MACNCEKNSAKRESYTVTMPNGSTISYSTEIEAAAKAARSGGTYTKN